MNEINEETNTEASSSTPETKKPPDSNAKLTSMCDKCKKCEKDNKSGVTACDQCIAKNKGYNRLKKHNKLTLLSANVNSIINKKISLQFNIDQIKPEIIILQETKLKRKSQLTLLGYRVFSLIR